MKNLGKPSVLLAVIAIFMFPADSYSADAQITPESTVPVIPAAAPSPTQTDASNKTRPFLSINGKIISKSDFDQSVSEAARRRLYHGAVNQEALARFQREALNETISRELVIAEAKRRGVVENQTKVDGAISSLEAGYASHPRWAAERAARMPKIREFYANASIFDEMESLARNISEPADNDVLEFYKNNERLFIEPKKESLLKRQPSDLAWTAFLQGLKDAATIVVDESELVPLEPAWEAARPKSVNESGQGPANHGK